MYTATQQMRHQYLRNPWIASASLCVRCLPDNLINFSYEILPRHTQTRCCRALVSVKYHIYQLCSHLVTLLSPFSTDLCQSVQPGYHPWFVHWIALQPVTSKEEHYGGLFLDTTAPNGEQADAFGKLLPSLPDPILLSDVLLDLRRDLEAFPQAMLGEVGLDRSFRVALDYSASPRELTPFTIPFEHQLAVVEAQLGLAVELGRNVSFHSVKSQMATMELLSRMSAKHGEKWNAISVDMHSCGLSAQTWTDIEVSFPHVSQNCSHLNATVRKSILTCSCLSLRS